MANQYDVLWYYTGGTHRGQWHAVYSATDEAREITRTELQRMGYVTRLGKQSVGAPEGAPMELLPKR